MDRSPQEDEATALYDSVFSTRHDFAFYDWAAHRFGGPILEVGCGTGRILIPTTEAGFEIVGIDPNASRVKRCQLEIETRNLAPLAKAEIGSILDYRTEQNFALVTMPFRTFQHILTPADQEQTLRNIWTLLQPGGHCIVDIFNPNIPFLANSELNVEVTGGPVFEVEDGRTVELRSKVVSRSFSHQTQGCEEIYVITLPDGSETKIVLPFTTRYTFKYEIEHLSRLAGFEVCETFGSFDRTPFGDEASDEILMILRRPD